jgi:hypothetical protein
MFLQCVSHNIFHIVRWVFDFLVRVFLKSLSLRHSQNYTP